jgi:hypothetical protein
MNASYLFDAMYGENETLEEEAAMIDAEHQVALIIIRDNQHFNF